MTSKHQSKQYRCRNSNLSLQNHVDCQARAFKKRSISVWALAHSRPDIQHYCQCFLQLIYTSKSIHL